MNALKIVSALSKFYSRDFQAEDEEQAENLRIKEMIFEQLEAAILSNDSREIADLTALILENTGCVEDIEIVEKLSERLVQKGLVLPEALKNFLHDSACNRWL
ncbi:hypothetical protein [Chitinilyticum piscinae]|uniref:Uncharacterized protein n=1 Tax=Chitinilyticum piscinae TaxID=2866724 RepID=A0A8J7KD10_9NEIS|nr:hypothetical protein [Chitinilyticum piscinae]MBE9608304.1 hypothetical protein [Chitinilyticum piscinae]